jgi:hypothetical protein
LKWYLKKLQVKLIQKEDRRNINVNNNNFEKEKRRKIKKNIENNNKIGN